MPRVPTSDALKAATGTLKPYKSRPPAPASDAHLTDTPPIGLTKDAREAWKLAISCAPKGVLTALDATVLERWARNYATYRKIAKQLDHEDIALVTEAGVTLNPLFITRLYK